MNLIWYKNFWFYGLSMNSRYNQDQQYIIQRITIPNKLYEQYQIKFMDKMLSNQIKSLQGVMNHGICMYIELL